MSARAIKAMIAPLSLFLATWGAAVVAGQLAPRPTQAPTTTQSSEDAQVTAISGCHLHGSGVYCLADGTEYHVDVLATATTDVPAQYTDCHTHGLEMFCFDADGQEVFAHPSDGGRDDRHGGHKREDEASIEDPKKGRNCHFHAGVEHCTGDDEHEGLIGRSCEAPARDYNISVRVGMLFVILGTSALGVFGPILLHHQFAKRLNLFFVTLKQFGTGVILSTAFVHLYTHASLMFASECVGDLGYEAVTSAILLAGIFVSFLIEFVGYRIITMRTRAEALTLPGRTRQRLSTDVVSILVMEAGILFHSLIIGLTMVVADDNFFMKLSVVIIFHQAFEGIALGTRIATIGAADPNQFGHLSLNDSEEADQNKSVPGAAVENPQPVLSPSGLSMWRKLGLAGLFAFITPIGMAIGIGVLHRFNGNDKSTLIAIGTLDALSAGILVWVGLVEMWAADWMHGAGSHGAASSLAEADLGTIICAGVGLTSGLVLMSLLGRWA